MNRLTYSDFSKKLKYTFKFHFRKLDRKRKAHAFSKSKNIKSISRIYVINLDRKPERWKEMCKELKRIVGDTGFNLLSIARRHSAVDARYLKSDIDNNSLIPYYSLYDQLQIEPNEKIPNDIKYRSKKIEMTQQEKAIVLSHIELWKLIADSELNYCLILEDDIYFEYGFANNFNKAWQKIIEYSSSEHTFDMFFLSYDEVGISEKRVLKEKIRKPKNGIWQASGYILSKSGAKKLLDMLPVFGPVDLWFNLKFNNLNVYLTDKPIIEQRYDIPSTNSYSIMPILAQIGAYTHEKPLVTGKKILKEPIFVFGPSDSGLTAISTALSILGYTCCNDLIQLPKQELNNFENISNLFNAYVNIGTFDNMDKNYIKKLYPNSKFIYTCQNESKIKKMNNDELFIPLEYRDKWELICSFLSLEYPSSPYPTCKDIGQQKIMNDLAMPILNKVIELKSDKSPWIISLKQWEGISVDLNNDYSKTILRWDTKESNNNLKWKPRNDTFPSNLAIFNPNNIKITEDSILQFDFLEEKSTVRSFSSASIVTEEKFLYGKFSVELKPANVSGLITGVFLHRNSPHQEIDIEFLGKDTTKMLINVFYNPGEEGTKLEYGYRGTPVIIDLGFDSSKNFHKYSIEWYPNFIQWKVDEKIVYKRLVWNPTPIPNLPLEFNINLWHSRSKEFAGKLNKKKIPAKSFLKTIEIENYSYKI